MSLINVDKIDPQSGTALEVGTSGDTVTVPSGVGLTLTDSTLLLPTTITSTTEVKTNKISPATGTAFALGDSGDTFTVPSGATIVNSGTATGFGGGLVLQVVTATDSTTRDTTSTSFVTGSNTLTLDITPASTDNKIFLIVNTIGYNSNGDDNSYTIYRGVTNLGGTLGLGYAQFGEVAAFAGQGNMSMSYLDSPSSTSALTYQVYFRAIASGTAELGKGNATSSITAFEIAG